jgi:hypothetical protein
VRWQDGLTLNTPGEREVKALSHVIAVLVCVLLAGPAQAADEGKCKPSDKPAQAPSPELSVVGKNCAETPTDFRFQMGETLDIKATGEAANEIEKVVGEAGVLTLHLDGVAMTGWPFSVLRVADTPVKELRLSFPLIRQPEVDVNRKAWDDVFTRQPGGYVMVLQPSLSIGSALARPVVSKLPVEFYVATGGRVAFTLFIAVLMFVGAFWWMVRHPSALRDETNGAYSLGKSQMAFWGLMVLLSFVGVWVMTGSMERIPSQVLVLLGISGATGLGAMVISQGKEATKKSDLLAEQAKLEDEKVAAAATGVALSPGTHARLAAIAAEHAALSFKKQTAGFLRDICSDGNGLSFHRLQVVVWTLVLGVIFVRSVAQVLSMPEFQENLLILMGISSGTYLGFKFPEKA